MTAALYIALEGVDGSGKSTQATRLSRWLQGRGARVRQLREPGSTPLAESLRQLLLSPSGGELSAVAEALLFFAARAEMIREQVAPALRAGEVVVAERCYLSTWVYQGAASDAPIAPELLAALTQATCGDVLPDRIFVLDVPGDVGAARRRGQLEDRIERRGSEFQARARAGYLELAATDPRVEVVDAAGEPDAVHAALTSRVEQLLAARR